MASKWKGFNDPLLRVLQLGNEAALSTRSDEIGTEHLVLGLVRVGTGFAARVLTALGIELTSLKSSVVSLLPTERNPDEWRKVPFSALVRLR